MQATEIRGDLATEDPEYRRGLEGAVGAAVDYALRGIEEGESCVPQALPEQARLAARRGISLDTVLRRYFAGNSLFGNWVLEEAERSGLLSGPELNQLLKTQAMLFDELVTTVSDAHRAATSECRKPSQRQAEQIRRLLAGELDEAPELTYDFSARHVGIVAAGAAATDWFSQCVAKVDCAHLSIETDDGSVWAWLGSRRPFEQVRHWADELDPVPEGVTVGAGEAAAGISGWRLTHRQALAAASVAASSDSRVAVYGEVALLAAALKDELLRRSLHDLYIRPLGETRAARGPALETLRAYFRSERNTSSTGALIGVSRQTVTNRLRTIEEQLGRSINSCGAELETAIRLEYLQNHIHR
jgi:DNA-binding PucR family transcriptional regulator